MRKNNSFTVKALDKICQTLNVNIKDIMRYEEQYVKRFLIIVAALFFAIGLYAEPKIYESQIEAFISKGNYIKEIIWINNSESISYYNKQTIFEITLDSNGEVCIINEKHERVSSFEKEGLEDVKLDANNNLILTYRFYY